jgi:glycosyltransferase involved in cell wall biosynthesis
MHGNFGKFFDEEIFFKIAERLAHENNLDYEINIIGSGPKVQLLRNAGLPNVHIYDGMSQEHIYKHLANASIGLSVHRDTEVMRRAFPVKVYEFVGAALPSVVIPVNQAHEALGLYRLGKCFSENNWQEAASFLLDLLSDDDLLGEYQRNIEENRWRFDRVQQVKKISRMVLKYDKQNMQ